MIETQWIDKVLPIGLFPHKLSRVFSCKSAGQGIVIAGAEVVQACSGSFIIPELGGRVQIFCAYGGKKAGGLVSPGLMVFHTPAAAFPAPFFQFWKHSASPIVNDWP